MLKGEVKLEGGTLVKARSRKFRVLKLQAKFIVLFMVLISVPFLISGLLVFNKFSSNIETNTRDATKQLVDQMALTLDKFVKEVERLTLAPVSDAEVMKVLSKHSMTQRNTVYMTTEQQAQMVAFISSTVFDQSEINSILIFTNNGHLFGISDSLADNSWSPDNESWMSKVDQADGALTVIPSHSVSYYSRGPRTMVSLARMIREPFTNRKLGIIKVDLEPSSFDKIFASVQLGNGGRLYIFDSQGQRIIPVGDAIADPDLNDPDMLTASGKAKFAGLNIVAQIPYKELNKDARALTSYTLFISLISLICAYIAAILSSNKLIKPIHHLQSKMKLIQKGAIEERATVATDDEIGELTEVFNKMMDEIDSLVREVYETKLRERETELAVLQSQMNPHFLYNSLETINMMAVRESQWELVNFVTSLGKLLRYTVDRKESTVTLLNEVLFVESYLQVQSMRNEGRIQLQLDIDPSLGSAIVPKLMLQPIIENALEHGMDSQPLIILLQAELDGEELLINVADDGVGMKADVWRAVEERMKVDREYRQSVSGFGQPTSGHGLRNVHQRIRLLYGEPYGVTIRCLTERGTMIKIRLPFRWGE
jgi:two-component system sensor histidine kinase YesM